MTTIRRPAKQQRVTLTRIFFVVFAIALLAIALFQIDSFPSSTSSSQTSRRNAPLLSPDRILIGQELVATATAQQQQQDYQLRSRKIDGNNVVGRGLGEGGGEKVNIAAVESVKDVGDSNEVDKRERGSGEAEEDEEVDPAVDERYDEIGDSGGEEGKESIESNSVVGNKVGGIDATTQRRRYAFELAKLDNGGDSGDAGTGSATTGRVVIETRPDWAPIGAKHFGELVGGGFYDDCRFFRVVKNFIVQFGMNGSPEKQKQYKDQLLKDDPVLTTNARGTVTYATSGPNTRTTQLFFNTREGGNKFLDDQGFAPFGVVVEGMEHVDRINSEYGEKPDQGRIRNRGNEYLNAEFPSLSYIISAREVSIVEDENEDSAADAADGE